MVFPLRGYRNPYPRNVRQNPFSFRPNPRNPTNANQLSAMAEQGASGLSKTLGNIQQILNLIQTATPVIEEYGPMIKNLPALYKMMKVIQEPDREEKSQPKKLDQTIPEEQHEPASIVEQPIESLEEKEENVIEKHSKPLLYI